MLNIKRQLRVVFFLLLLTLGFLSKAVAQDVVVHPSVKQSVISRNVLRAVFGMRLRQWSDGSPITVFVLQDDAPLHIAFSKKVLNVFPYQLRRAWDRQVFSGTGQSPQKVGSLEEMKTKVAQTPGAVGYLNEEEVFEDLRKLTIR